MSNHRPRLNTGTSSASLAVESIQRPVTPTPDSPPPPYTPIASTSVNAQTPQLHTPPSTTQQCSRNLQTSRSLPSIPATPIRLPAETTRNTVNSNPSSQPQEAHVNTTPNVNMNIQHHPITAATDAGSSTSTEIQRLPFYHPAPIVPIPPGLQPLPPLRNTALPTRPYLSTATTSPTNWYIAVASVNPGLHRATWDEFRPNIEAHRGLPRPYRCEFQRLSGQMEDPFPAVRVLPPPPRPDVRIEGEHFWIVYVGRVPGFYTALFVPLYAPSGLH